MKSGTVFAETLISLNRIPDLAGIRTSPDGGLLMGAATRIRGIERSEIIGERFTALWDAAQVLAAPQIRNVATVGGNLCNASPCADTAGPLIVLSARPAVTGPFGEREIPVTDLFLGPGMISLRPPEILTEIRVPSPPPGAGSAYIKQGRVSMDLAVASAAAYVEMENGICRVCRLAAGSVAPVPLFLSEASLMASGRKPTSSMLADVQESVSAEVSPITDVRSTAEYRKAVAGVLAVRALKKAVERAGGMI
jgi:carbon-monoxide dehydrogenase medium subunit